MNYISVFEKGNHGRVLEVVSTDHASLAAMAAYNGSATRARCADDVFVAYSHGKEITREYDFVGGKIVGRYESHA
jgi:hypothetical protein